MTDNKRRKFAHEILVRIGISGLVALILFLVLTGIASGVSQEYCFQNDVPMTEFDWMDLDRWIYGCGAVISILCFSLLFLALLADRMAYIRKITDGINTLRMGQEKEVPLEGNNELTELADAVNHMSAARRQVREKEQLLAQEKDQLIRTLSHDIRTPLTSILAYSEYMVEEALSPEEQKTHLRLIRRKAEQIRQLTDLLLEGGKRNPEHFQNARLLMEQLAQEFEAELEDQFAVCPDLSRCGSFEGSFDVQELRRIFDNLSSNVAKYADPGQPVCLSVGTDEQGITIRQTNAVRQAEIRDDSYGIGISSIRRIAQHYGGRVKVEQTGETFAIAVLLSDF